MSKLQRHPAATSSLSHVVSWVLNRGSLLFLFSGEWFKWWEHVVTSNPTCSKNGLYSLLHLVVSYQVMQALNPEKTMWKTNSNHLVIENQTTSRVDKSPGSVRIPKIICCGHFVFSVIGFPSNKSFVIWNSCFPGN